MLIGSRSIQCDAGGQAGEVKIGLYHRNCSRSICILDSNVYKEVVLLIRVDSILTGNDLDSRISRLISLFR